MTKTSAVNHDMKNKTNYDKWKLGDHTQLYHEYKGKEPDLFLDICPEGAFCVGRAKKIDVRASVHPCVRSRSICQKSANLWQGNNW